MSDEIDADRGRLAEDVLNNPVYQSAYTTIEDEVIKSWRECKNIEDREQLHKLLKLLGKVKAAMESTMRKGQLAQDNLIQKKSLLEKAAGRLRRNG